MNRVTIAGVSLSFSHPDTTVVRWIGQQEIMERLLASWLVVAKEDTPLCPRLIGKPGVGKTTLAIAAARILGKEVYVYQCTMDTRPEDLLVTPVLAESGKINYHASPVVTAMIRGGVCILDEGNRMSEKSWASLAPLLDHRRYVESILAGIKIDAHPEFRCCVTMNDDASTYELPDYIMSRIQPMIEINFPPRAEEMEILKYNIPYAGEQLLKQTVDFLQKAHRQDLNLSTRDGIHILRYSIKRLTADNKLSRDKAWREAVNLITGVSPEEIERPPQQSVRDMLHKKFSDLGEFFVDPDFFTKDPFDDDNDEN